MIKKEIPLRLFSKLLYDIEAGPISNYFKVLMDPKEIVENIIRIISFTFNMFFKKKAGNMHFNINDKIFLFISVNQILLINYSKSLGELLDSRIDVINLFPNISQATNGFELSNKIFLLPDEKIQNEIKLKYKSMTGNNDSELFYSKDVLNYSIRWSFTCNNFTTGPTIMDFLLEVFFGPPRRKVNCFIDEYNSTMNSPQNFKKRLLQKLLMKFYLFNHNKSCSFYFHNELIIEYKSRTNIYDIINNLDNFVLFYLITKKTKNYRNINKKPILFKVFKFLQCKIDAKFIYNYFNQIEFNYLVTEKVVNLKAIPKIQFKLGLPNNYNLWNRGEKEHFSTYLLNFRTHIESYFSSHKKYKKYLKYIDSFL
jgi:hypothetical protein